MIPPLLSSVFLEILCLLKDFYIHFVALYGRVAKLVEEQDEFHFQG
jgi:hypothetical protein